jgi:dihydroneopterin aldolase
VTDRRLDVIRIDNLVVDCIVGVYPAERLAPQPLRLDVALHLDTRRAATGAGLGGTIDYARLAGELRFLLESCQFLLLETAAEALCRYMLAPATEDTPHATIEEVGLKLTKPIALGGTVQPSLEVHRVARETTYVVEDKPFGKVDIIHETKACGVYRLRVAPGRAIPTHEHRVMEEAELVLGGGLLLQGKPVEAGTAHRWPRSLRHRYDNPTSIEQTILCVDRPAFIPADEIEVEPPAGGLVVVEGESYYPSGSR